MTMNNYLVNYEGATTGGYYCRASSPEEAITIIADILWSNRPDKEKLKKSLTAELL